MNSTKTTFSFKVAILFILCLISAFSNATASAFIATSQNGEYLDLSSSVFVASVQTNKVDDSIWLILPITASFIIFIFFIFQFVKQIFEDRKLSEQ